jgi:hypothetical protein
MIGSLVDLVSVLVGIHPFPLPQLPQQSIKRILISSIYDAG